MTAQKIQQLFDKHPEILYGFAPAADLSIQGYCSILSFAVPYGKQLTLKNYTEEDFEEGIRLAREKQEQLAAELEAVLSTQGVPFQFPPTAQSDECELLAPVSFKAAAVRAGLGWMGKNDVLITKEYGPRVRLSAVLIDAPFDYGTTVSQSNCPISCHRCVDACPVNALSGERWKPDKLRADLIDYQRCNQFRSLSIPKHGEKSPCGLCIAACPVGIHQKNCV